MFPTIASIGFGILLANGTAPRILVTAQALPEAKAPLPIKLGPQEKMQAKDRELKEIDKRTLEVLAKERASGNPRNVHATIKALDQLVATMKQSKFEDQESLKAFEEELAAWILLGKK